MILRRRLLAAIGGLAVLAPLKSAVPRKAAAPNPGNGSMEIKHIGSQPAGKGPADYFTGAVRIDPPSSKRPSRRALRVPVSHSSPAHAQLGILTHLGKR